MMGIGFPAMPWAGSCVPPAGMQPMACGWAEAHLSLLPAAPPNSAAADRAAWCSQARGDSFPHESQSSAPKISQFFPELSGSRLDQFFFLSKLELQHSRNSVLRIPWDAVVPWKCEDLRSGAFLKPQVILYRDPEAKAAPWIS